MIYAKELPPLKEIKEAFDYNPETGHLIRKVTKSKRPLVGKRAGTLHKTGYRQVRLNNGYYKEHRIIYALYYNEQLSPEVEIDHINGDTSDNRITNLRKVSRQGNCQNRCVARNNTSGVRGVYYKKDEDKWRVRITHSGKRILVGDYRTLEEAIAAREKAEAEYNYLTRH